MAERRALVVGRALAAQTAALLLARRGWSVVLVGGPSPQPDAPHFLNDAALRVLREELPGLEQELLSRGARRQSVAMSLRQDFGPAAELRPDDDAVAMLCCRAALIHDALRRRVKAAPGIAERDEPAVGFLNEGPRVVGVRTASGGLRADAVIDAAGASSPRRALLAAAGLPADRVATWGPRYAALTRFYGHAGEGPHFRLIARDGARGGSLPVERGSFAVNFILPERLLPSDSEGRRTFFERLADAVPGARAHMRRPTTELRLTRGLVSMESDFYRAGSPAAALEGLYPLGDAVWSSNPIYARGYSLALLQAAALTRSLEEPTPGAARRAQARALARLRPLWRAGAFNELADAPVLSSPGALAARAARGYFMRVLEPRMRRDPDLLRRFLLMYHLRLPPWRVATLRQHAAALLLR